MDYFSLDVEGAELDVLRTLPWDKVDIRYEYIFVSATLLVIMSVNSCLRLWDLGPYRYSMFRKKYENFCDRLLRIAKFWPNRRPTSETEYFTECTCCWICERSQIRPLLFSYREEGICERLQIRPLSGPYMRRRKFVSVYIFAFTFRSISVETEFVSEFDSSKSLIHNLLEQQGTQLMTFSTINNEKYLVYLYYLIFKSHKQFE